jgi:hypothetical protein
MLKVIMWTLAVAALSTGCVMTGFLVIASAKRVLAAGVPLPPALKATCLFWGIVGVASDSVYNGLVASVRFREWPRLAQVARHPVRARTVLSTHPNPRDGWRPEGVALGGDFECG